MLAHPRPPAALHPTDRPTPRGALVRCTSSLGRLALALVGLALWLGCPAPQGTTARDSDAVPQPGSIGPWNVIVFAPDTFRGDRLSANGYARATTPNLDALAAEGANFRQAITVAPRTWQSFSSILTGRYPPRHGVRFIFDEPIPEDVPVLGSYLRRFGYDTAAFDNIHFLKGMTGGDDFDRYVKPDKDEHPGVPLDEALLDELEAFVLEPRTAPFLAFVRLSGGHWPYTDRSFLPEGQDCADFDHAFNFGTYGVHPGAEGFELTNEKAFRRLIWTPDRTERQKAHRIAHYDSEIHDTDRMIGEVLDTLRERGILERTIVAVTSDHGESFGDHGYLQHGPRVDESVMHVPLLIRLPEGHPDRRPGVVVDALVRVTDLFPTLVDALGLPPPPDTDGVSLMPLVRGGSSAEMRWAYGESGRSFMGVDPERHLEGVAGKHRMLRTERWKLLYIPDAEGGEARLYDIQADPGEQRNVAREHPEIVASLMAHLQEVQAATIEKDGEPELTEAQLERLRALGYVQ